VILLNLLPFTLRSIAGSPDNHAWLTDGAVPLISTLPQHERTTPAWHLSSD
jgi:hypothetical protein